LQIGFFEVAIVTIPLLIVLMLFLCIKTNLERVIDSELEYVSDISEDDEEEDKPRPADVRERRKRQGGKEVVGNLFNQVFLFISSVFLVSCWVIGLVIEELIFLIPLSFLVGLFLLVILAFANNLLTSRESPEENDESRLKAWRCPECQVRLQVSEVKRIQEGTPIQCPSCGIAISHEPM
jgi:DNA-directed RNA polymerase subunit RPC12/RpoP